MHRKHVELILMTLFFACCLFFANTSSAASTPQVANSKAIDTIQALPVMGFKSWKSNQVELASLALSDFRVKQQANGPDAPAKINGVPMNPGDALRQLEFNLEIAKGLTIHDYFALYLKDKDTQEIAEIVKMLSPEELSALLVAYRKQLFEPEMGEKQQAAQAESPL